MTAFLIVLAIALAVLSAVLAAMLAEEHAAKVNLNTSDGPSPRWPTVVGCWNFTNAVYAAHALLSYSEGIGGVEGGYGYGGTIEYPLMSDEMRQRVAFFTNKSKVTVLDAMELGGNACELQPELCRFSVGFGGSPSDHMMTTLDAMIMDGRTMAIGAVGELKNVKMAVSVARLVSERTKHTLLVGEDATQFAKLVGFDVLDTDLITNHSRAIFDQWVADKHQPNYWKGKAPYGDSAKRSVGDELDHDTCPLVGVDRDGNMACAATTNGLTFKILGRVGDTPIGGAGCYVDNDYGAAGATGDGDVMMRFLVTYEAVRLLRDGLTPEEAAEQSLAKMLKFYPQTSGAIIVMNKRGEYSAAKTPALDKFPWVTMSAGERQPTQHCIGMGDGCTVHSVH